ncbi:MAG: hypothetical protein IT376_14710 [Polyangiaceae bacterium]|nr:hypothetical protein [Polyangiaceae bacterium]
MTKRVVSLGVVALALTAAACGGKSAPPFDTMPSAQVIALRLQNFEPPPAPAAASPTPTPQSLLPPEIMSWVQQSGLGQLIPPGVIPPGVLGGVTPTAPAPAQQDTAPRFPQAAPNFRILSQAPILDAKLKEELAELLGDEDNFDSNHSTCLYAEMGLSFQSGPGLPNDILISFSCNQVQSRNFAWPHPAAGMKPGTVEKLSQIVKELWPAGS